MITSVLFRHGADEPSAKRRVEHRLNSLYSEGIHRVKVTVDKVPYAGSPACNYQCHISLRALGKTNVDIYADKRQPDMAIDDAFDRLYVALNSRQLRRLRKRR